MTGSAINKKRKTPTTAIRVNGSPTIAMKSNVANWYIKPNPISKVPMGMPNRGFLNVTKATRKARRMGSGCGKSGINDKPSAMLARVITNVKILSGRGSSACSFCSFSLFFSFLCLNHERVREVESVAGFNYYDLKPYFTNPLLKLVWKTLMENCKPNFDVLESMGKHIALLRPLLPNHAIICIGEYPMKILLKGHHANKTEDPLPIFIDQSTKEITKGSQSRLDPYSIMGLDTKSDTHFWFHCLPHVAKNDAFMGRLKNKLGDKQRDAIMVMSIWDGVGSALLPALISQFAEWNTSAVALTMLPSKVQPSDVHFNAFSSMGMWGASFKMYGSLENILNAALFNPFLTFDLSSTSVLYVLLRMPLQFKDKLPKGKIELAVANWFKKNASLNSICVTDPVYVEDVSDRIDVAMFVGGFDLTEMFASLEKKVNPTKNQVVKKGWIKEEEGKGIVKSLTAN